MNNQYGKYLPLGTVVLLRGAKKRLMITGFCSVSEENNGKIYDYTGCLYPEGIITSKQMALFDHSQIEKIYYLGLKDKEEVDFKKALIEQVNKLIQQQKNQSK